MAVAPLKFLASPFDLTLRVSIDAFHTMKNMQGIDALAPQFLVSEYCYPLTALGYLDQQQSTDFAQVVLKATKLTPWKRIRLAIEAVHDSLTHKRGASNGNF
jgi:hypothetical protein